MMLETINDKDKCDPLIYPNQGIFNFARITFYSDFDSGNLHKVRIWS